MRRLSTISMLLTLCLLQPLPAVAAVGVGCGGAMHAVGKHDQVDARSAQQAFAMTGAELGAQPAPAMHGNDHAPHCPCGHGCGGACMNAACHGAAAAVIPLAAQGHLRPVYRDGFVLRQRREPPLPLPLRPPIPLS